MLKITWSLFTCFCCCKILWLAFKTNRLVPNSRSTFSSKLFSFETQRCELSLKSALGVWNLKKIRKTLHLQFGTKRFHANRWVKQSVPGVLTLLWWVLNSRWRKFFSRITSLRSKLHSQFFCLYATRYLPILKCFILCHELDPPHLWGVFDTSAYAVVFQLGMYIYIDFWRSGESFLYVPSHFLHS